MSGPTGRPARGRRDNGLDAREFTAVGDLDPRVGEHLLDVLAIAGIAAYLQPSADFNPIVRTTILPSTPSDRLWVDRDHTDAARALIAKVETESAPVSEERPAPAAARDALDIDAAFKDIVAGYDTHSDVSWPAAEDAARAGRGEESGTGTSLVRADHLTPIGPPSPGPRDHTLSEPSDDDLLGEVDEGYEPPPPPPIPRPSGQATAAVVAVLLGFVLFFRPDLLPMGTETVQVIGVLGVLGGAAMLVYRLRDGRDPDEDPDDGAVV